MNDDKLIDAMATAWATTDGNAQVVMRAVLAVVRAHDGDATRCPGCDHQRLEAGELRRELAAARAERGITASPWRYREWGGLVVGGGEGSAEVLICTMATNTRHDEARHNRELIVEAPTLRARVEKSEAEAARLRAAIERALEKLAHLGIGAAEAELRDALQEGGR